MLLCFHDDATQTRTDKHQDPKFGMISMGPISEDLSLRTEDDYDVDVPLINGNGVDANSDADAIFDEIVSLIRSGS